MSDPSYRRATIRKIITAPITTFSIQYRKIRSKLCQPQLTTPNSGNAFSIINAVVKPGFNIFPSF